MTHEQRQLTDEHIALWREGCTLLEAMTPTEYAEGRSDRCRRFRAIHKELTWGLLDPHSASLFDARLDGPCDMRPEYARAIDWPISQAWRRALIEATGLTPKKFEPLHVNSHPSRSIGIDTARSDVACGDDGDRASGMDASQHHVPGLD